MKEFLIVLIIVLGQTGMTLAQEFHFKFQHSALGVFDVDESAEFYIEILGFKEIPNRSQTPGIRWLSLGHGLELHLIQTKDLTVNEIRQTHLAWSTDRFDQFLDVLEKHDLDYTDWPGNKKGPSLRADGVHQVYFQDPNGYWIEINDEYGKN
ncbi:MAG: VOC family protein [Cyclobacteriaceae bacterium]|nr:VOC family protein [Cyclobacteriaceae bacterium]